MPSHAQSSAKLGSRLLLGLVMGTCFVGSGSLASRLAKLGPFRGSVDCGSLGGFAGTRLSRGTTHASPPQTDLWQPRQDAERLDIEYSPQHAQVHCFRCLRDALLAVALASLKPGIIVAEPQASAIPHLVPAALRFPRRWQSLLNLTSRGNQGEAELCELWPPSTLLSARPSALAAPTPGFILGPSWIQPPALLSCTSAWRDFFSMRSLS